MVLRCVKLSTDCIGLPWLRVSSGAVLTIIDKWSGDFLSSNGKSLELRSSSLSWHRLHRRPETLLLTVIANSNRASLQKWREWMNMNENGIRWCWIDSLAWDCSGSFSAASSPVMPHHVKAKRPQSLVGRARVESWDIGISSVPPCCDSCYMKSNMLSQNSEGLPALLVSTLTS